MVRFSEYGHEGKGEERENHPLNDCHEDLECKERDRHDEGGIFRQAGHGAQHRLPGGDVAEESERECDELGELLQELQEPDKQEERVDGEESGQVAAQAQGPDCQALEATTETTARASVRFRSAVLTCRNGMAGSP